MNSLRNRVVLIGHLGAQPETKTLSTGSSMTRFRIATTESYKNDNGERVSETQWHNLVAWGKVAQVAGKYLDKGREVAVEGKLVTRNYTDKEGVKRYTTEIVVNDFLLIGSRPKAQE
jgi:single-strand DNA-binding protein